MNRSQTVNNFLVIAYSGHLIFVVFKKIIVSMTHVIQHHRTPEITT